MDGGRRSSIEIIGEILRLSADGAGRTRIMYAVNMSHSQMKKYIEFLILHGFLNEMPEHTQGSNYVYYTTLKGKSLLKDIDKLDTILLNQNLQEGPQPVGQIKRSK